TTNISSPSLSFPRSEKLQWARAISYSNRYIKFANTTLSIPPLQAMSSFFLSRNGKSLAIFFFNLESNSVKKLKQINNNSGNYGYSKTEHGANKHVFRF